MSTIDRIWAAAYDRLAAKADASGDYAWRQRLVAPATGTVLEIGVGTGRNLPLYRDADRVVAIEPNRHARALAERRAALAPLPVEVRGGDAAALEFPDASFDTVVAGLVLCTVGAVGDALAEARRVLRPGGTLRFWEHVRSDDPAIARWQDRLETPWGWVGRGCHPNRATASAIAAAGFELLDVERYDADGVPAIVRPHILGTARAA